MVFIVSACDSSEKYFRPSQPPTFMWGGEEEYFRWVHAIQKIFPHYRYTVTAVYQNLLRVPVMGYSCRNKQFYSFSYNYHVSHQKNTSYLTNRYLPFRYWYARDTWLLP